MFLKNVLRSSLDANYILIFNFDKFCSAPRSLTPDVTLTEFHKTRVPENLYPSYSYSVSQIGKKINEPKWTNPSNIIRLCISKKVIKGKDFDLNV